MKSDKILFTVGLIISILILILLVYSIVSVVFFKYDKTCLFDEANSYCDNAVVKKHFFIGKPYYRCEGNNRTKEYHPTQLEECHT